MDMTNAVFEKCVTELLHKSVSHSQVLYSILDFLVVSRLQKFVASIAPQDLIVCWVPVPELDING